MDYYTVVVIVTLLGFFLLAALLLVPVYIFLKREERASQRWTKDVLSRRSRRQGSRSESANGTSSKTNRPPSPDA